MVWPWRAWPARSCSRRAWSWRCPDATGHAASQLVPFSAVEWRYFAVFWPGNGDVEEGEDVALGGGEPVQHDAVLGVGQPQALEGGQDVASGGAGRATLGQQPVQVLVGTQGTAKVGLEQPEEHQREPDDADQGGDAVVVVQEDRSHPQGLLGVAVAPLDQGLVFVDAQQ